MPRREKVTKVIDGDTFWTNRRKNPVRLANVNAPEKWQRGGYRAKSDLEAMIGGKTVEIDTVARDRYRRSVANVKVGSRSVNSTMRQKTRRPKPTKRRSRR